MPLIQNQTRNNTEYKVSYKYSKKIQRNIDYQSGLALLQLLKPVGKLKLVDVEEGNEFIFQKDERGNIKSFKFNNRLEFFKLKK